MTDETLPWPWKPPQGDGVRRWKLQVGAHLPVNGRDTRITPTVKAVADIIPGEPPPPHPDWLRKYPQFRLRPMDEHPDGENYDDDNGFHAATECVVWGNEDEYGDGEYVGWLHPDDLRAWIEAQR